MAELAPMPIPSEARITTVKATFLRSMRKASRRSCNQRFINPPVWISDHMMRRSALTRKDLVGNQSFWFWSVRRFVVADLARGRVVDDPEVIRRFFTTFRMTALWDWVRPEP